MRASGLLLLALLPCMACRSVAERPTSVRPVADRVADASIEGGTTASVARVDAGVPVAEARRSPFSVVATVGGFGRIHRLADGALVFASRGVFRRLTAAGGIERIGDIDIERRGLELANNVDAIVGVAGALPSPIFVATNHGHFRSRYESKTYVYDGARFALQATAGSYDKIVRWKDDVLLAHTLGVGYDASVYEAPDLPGRFAVVRGKKVAVPELPNRFIVLGWTAFPDGGVFAVGEVKPDGDSGPLRTARTFLSWSPGAKTPATETLPNLPADPWIDGLVGRRADDLWISGAKGYLAHRGANGIQSMPSPCTEIVASSADADGRLYLVCGDDRHGPLHDPRLLLHKQGRLHVRTGDGFEEVPLPDFTKSAYAEKLRSSFYTRVYTGPVEVEDEPMVAQPSDDPFIPYDVEARARDDVWVLAYSESADRTAILRRAPGVAVRSLDHDDAVSENEQPAPPATRACTNVFVSLGEPSAAAIDKAKRVVGVGVRPFTARVHRAQHLGFFVQGVAPQAFTGAQSTAAIWAKEGFTTKLLCRVPVALTMPLPDPP